MPASPGIQEANNILKKITALLDRKNDRPYDTGAVAWAGGDALLTEINEVLERPPRPLRSALRVSYDSKVERERPNIEEMERHPEMPQEVKGTEDYNKSKAVSWGASGSMESAKAYNEHHSSDKANGNRFEYISSAKYQQEQPLEHKAHSSSTSTSTITSTSTSTSSFASRSL